MVYTMIEAAQPSLNIMIYPIEKLKAFPLDALSVITPEFSGKATDRHFVD